MKKLLFVFMGLMVISSLSVFAAGQQETGAATADMQEVYASIPDGEASVAVKDITFSDFDEEYTVGMAMLNVNTGFFKALSDSIENELEANGVKALVSDCESDAAKQVSQVENFMAQGVDALIINPADPQAALNLVLRKAADEGIPVIAVDVPPDAGAPYMTAFVTDAYTLGYLVGKETATQYVKKNNGSAAGEYAIIGGTEGNSIAAARNKGMRDGIREVSPDGALEEVSFLYAGAYSSEAGLKTAENMLIAHPEIDILLGTCDDLALGGLAAAKRQGLASNLILGGVDGSRGAMEIIKEGGAFKATGLNSPYDVGAAAARAMIAYLVDGTTPEARKMVLKPEVITEKNVNDFYNPNAPF